MKSCIIVKTEFEEMETDEGFHDDEYEIYIVGSHGYGPSWSSNRKEARVFRSVQAAEDYMSGNFIYGARVETVDSTEGDS